MRTRMLHLAVALSLALLPALASAHRSTKASAGQQQIMVKAFNQAAQAEFGSPRITGITAKDLVKPRVHRQGGKDRLIFTLAGGGYLGIPHTCAALQLRTNLRVSVDPAGKSPVRVSRKTIFRKPPRRTYDF